MTTTTAEPLVFIARLKGSRSTGDRRSGSRSSGDFYIAARATRRRSASLSGERRSRWLQTSISGAERLLSDGGESNHELCVVVQRLDAEHRADSELRVPDLHAQLQRQARRLILVFVRVGGRGFPHAIAAAPPAVRVRPELVVREVPLIPRR